MTLSMIVFTCEKIPYFYCNKKYTAPPPLQATLTLVLDQDGGQSLSLDGWATVLIQDYFNTAFDRKLVALTSSF